MKKTLFFLCLVSSGFLLSACGSDSKSTTNNPHFDFPNYTSEEDCSSNALNPTVTTDIGVVRVGIPGNTACPYRKAVRRDLFVEAYVMRTRVRDAFSIGPFGISAQVECHIGAGCYAYKHQCPPHFSLVRRGNGGLALDVNVNVNTFGRHNDYYNGYRGRDVFRHLPNDRVWCYPQYGSRWYEDWLDRVDTDIYL